MVESETPESTNHEVEMRAGWMCVCVCVWSMGCATTSPPSPREDTRALRPGAEVAQEAGVATKELLEREGQSRIRYASSMEPEGEGEGEGEGGALIEDEVYDECAPRATPKPKAKAEPKPDGAAPDAPAEGSPEGDDGSSEAAEATGSQ